MNKLLALLIVLIHTTIFANTKMADFIDIKNAYIRMMPPMMSMTSAFMQLKNTSSKDIVLKDLQSDLAVFTELHTSILKSDGTASMKHIENLIIKANSSIILQRGGKHVMFMRLKHKLILNDTYHLIFNFIDGSKKELTLKVKKL
jgi:copper(I)-binding protein